MVEKEYRMLTIEEILSKLKDRNLTLIARKIGVDPSTVHRLRASSSYEVVCKVSKYLQDN